MIRNLTRHTCIARNAVVLTSSLGHARGLMFQREIIPHVLLFKTERKVSLHTFFFAAPIDVVFVNTQKVVCEIREHLVPFSFCMPHTKAQCVIEAKAGVVKETKTEVGDRLNFSPSEWGRAVPNSEKE